MAGVPNQISLPTELNFGIRPVSLAAVHESAGHLRSADAPFARDAAFPGLRKASFDIRCPHSPDFARVTLVAFDSAYHRVMRSPVDTDVSCVIAFMYVVVILDDRVVDYGRRVVVIDDGSLVDIGDSHRAVIVDAVKMTLVDDDGIIQIAIAPDVDADPGNRIHYHRADSPVIVGIVRLRGSQRDPAHIVVPVDPAHSSRTPIVVRIPVVVIHPGCDATDPGRTPVPTAAAVDAHPVPIVMSHITERFVGNPTVVPIIHGPSARRERRPACVHPGGSPHGPVLAFVVDLLPSAVLLKGIGIILEIGRKVFNGIPLHLDALGPKIVPGQVPVIPVAVDLAVAGHDLPGIGDNRCGARHHFVSGVVALVDEFHRPGDRDDLHRFIPHVDVEDRIAIGNDIAKRRCHHNDTLFTPVDEAGDSRGDIDFRQVWLELDELNLRASTDADPGSVGENELGPGILIRVERILQAERGIIGNGRPILFFINVAQQLPLHMGHTADQDLFVLARLGRCNPRKKDCRQKQQSGPHQPHRSIHHFSFETSAPTLMAPTRKRRSIPAAWASSDRNPAQC